MHDIRDESPLSAGFAEAAGRAFVIDELTAVITGWQEELAASERGDSVPAYMVMPTRALRVVQLIADLFVADLTKAEAEAARIALLMAQHTLVIDATHSDALVVLAWQDAVVAIRALIAELG